jgi:hypothetical protein
MQRFPYTLTQFPPKVTWDTAQYHNWEIDNDRIHEHYSDFIICGCAYVCLCVFSLLQFYHVCKFK